MNIVILTGGVGKRLWPLGRKNNPKQFFPIITGKPLVKETPIQEVKHLNQKLERLLTVFEVPEDKSE